MLLLNAVFEAGNLSRLARLVLVLLHITGRISFTAASAVQYVIKETIVMVIIPHARVITISSSIYERAPLLSLSSRNPYARFPNV